MSNFQKVTFDQALTVLGDARAHGIIDAERYVFYDSPNNLRSREPECELGAVDLQRANELFEWWVSDLGFEGAHKMSVEIFLKIRKANYIIRDLEEIKTVIDRILKDCFSASYLIGKDDEVYSLAKKYMPMFSDEDRPTIEQLATLREFATQSEGFLPVHLAIVCAYGSWLRSAINNPENL